MAITKFDMFDFLIDIVPREEIKPSRSESKPQSGDQVSSLQSREPRKAFTPWDGSFSPLLL